MLGILCFYCYSNCNVYKFFNKLFTKFTCDPLLIKNSIPMGIEKLSKKIPLPRPAPEVLLPPKKYLYIQYRYFYLFTVEVALGELAGVAGEEKTNLANAN